MKEKTKIALSGAAAGIANGLFGAGGGMLLVPLLSVSTNFEESSVFPSSVSIILPMSLISLMLGNGGEPLPWKDALPYLIGSIGGGILAGITGNKIPVKWLHRILGIVIIWGGIRYLC